MAENTNHNLDAIVDVKIKECLSLDTPKSFFLFAGAGSGKTRSLVNALKHVDKHFGKRLNLTGQKVGVITYTNAACDEIESRIDYNKLFAVSTIHSFAWDLIKSFTNDIKIRIKSQIEKSLFDLEDQQSRSRGKSKTSIDRARKIESKKKRIAQLDHVVKFTYSPKGDNRGKDALNHAEVIDLFSCFLLEKKQMQSIVVRKFPILLIDESQDTNKHLVDSLFAVEAALKGSFSLGLIGDMMQRIYLDGKVSLGSNIPVDWEKPTKRLNHRCPKRIVNLINKIRDNADGQQQEARTDAIEGIVRLFIVNDENKSKMDIESAIAQQMADITKDNLWFGEKEDVQTLTLEHHMASKRLGFDQLFDPLYKQSVLKSGMLDGSNSGLRLFHQILLPLYQAWNEGDKFSIARIVKKYSDLIQVSKNEINQFKHAQHAVEDLFSLWHNDKDPSLLDVLKKVNMLGLFPLPEPLSIIVKRTPKDIEIIDDTSGEQDQNSDLIIDAWDVALQAPFSQIELYSKYISGEGKYDTHQGVKGQEFERVLIVLDDKEARGRLFSFDKLFGIKPLSSSDKKNKSEGKETGFDRTLRLFYVICSRAKSSLAIVIYSKNSEELTKNALDNGWFTSDEIIVI